VAAPVVIEPEEEVIYVDRPARGGRVMIVPESERPRMWRPERGERPGFRRDRGRRPQIEGARGPRPSMQQPQRQLQQRPVRGGRERARGFDMR
jgi:hypothetical protein